jgi:hypothetical protein
MLDERVRVKNDTGQDRRFYDKERNQYIFLAPGDECLTRTPPQGSVFTVEDVEAESAKTNKQETTKEEIEDGNE